VNIDGLHLNEGELSTVFSTGTAKEIIIDTPSGTPHHSTGSGVILATPLLIKHTRADHSRSYLNEPAIGTPPRIEREYKFAISKSDNQKASLDDISLTSLVNQTGEILTKASLDSSIWQAPKFALEPAYRVATAVEANVYRDVYLDTPDNKCYNNDISYRLRHRFKDLKSHNDHLRKPHLPRFWPYRLEFQAKTGRKKLTPGLSTISEARLEFRQQSHPFNDADLRPPPPPWTFAEYLPWMQSGTFKGRVGTPGKHVVETLAKLYPNEEMWHFDPKVVVISERGRAHLQLKTPWGSGPNPDQAFIITIDKASIYNFDNFISYQKQASSKENKPTSTEALGTTHASGTLLEFEIEFERNVSVGVMEEKAKLEAVHNSFLHDQEQILKSLKSGLALYGYDVQPMSKSKYIQAIDIVNQEQQLDKAS
jgi:hypothetical protein